MKDTTLATTLGIKFARVAIYDRVAGVSLDDILNGHVDADPFDVLQLVRRRTVS